MHREYSPPEETVLSPSPLHNTKAEMKSSEAEGTDEERRLPGPTPLPVFSPMTSETVGSSRGNGLLCLKWNNFEKHIVQSFTSIFQTEELTDVTLVPDTGEPIKAHKIILALSSPYFRKIFQVKTRVITSEELLWFLHPLLLFFLPKTLTTCLSFSSN